MLFEIVCCCRDETGDFVLSWPFVLLVKLSEKGWDEITFMSRMHFCVKFFLRNTFTIAIDFLIVQFRRTRLRRSKMEVYELQLVKQSKTHKFASHRVEELRFTIANVPQTSRKAKVVRLSCLSNLQQDCRWFVFLLYTCAKPSIANLHKDLLGVWKNEAETMTIELSGRRRFVTIRVQKCRLLHMLSNFDENNQLENQTNDWSEELTEKPCQRENSLISGQFKRQANNSIVTSPRFPHLKSVLLPRTKQSSDEHPVMWFQTIEILLTSRNEKYCKKNFHVHLQMVRPEFE